MNFEKYYKQLNPAQQAAVDAVEGPVMVVAGPGTGKTQILTLRIANILQKTQIGPGNVLALTFTEAGVSAMRRRLAELIGSPAYSVTISTFHGFCNDIIKNYPSEFPRIIGSENITEVDQIRIIENAIMTLPLKELKPFGDQLYYVNVIKASINQLKREGVSPERFVDIVQSEQKNYDTIDDLKHEKGAHKGKIKGEYQKLAKQIAKNIELSEVYEFYQNALTEKKLYDYSDMIMEVVRELQRNPDLLLQLQEQYQYILVDEHQDTNNAQNKVIELLCNFHPDPNLFVVGDEKQAIFRFQGASLENFLYFQKLYPSAKLIVLEDNYRSTQSILDAAHSILAGKKELRAKAGNPETKIRLGAFTSPDSEAFFLAQDIKTKISNGTSPADIAILYRENRDAFPISHMLEKFGVPYVIESDQDIMSDPNIQKLLLLFRAIIGFGSDEKVLEVMHVDFLGITPLDTYRIMASAQEQRISPFVLLKSPDLLEKLHLDDAAKVYEFYKKLSAWKTLSDNIGVEDLFERVVRESGFLSALLKESDLGDKLDSVNGLFDELKSLVERNKHHTLADFLSYLDVLQSNNILIKKSIPPNVQNVRLMTAHRSKGQEFSYVYIVMAYDGHWGNKRRPNLITLPSSVFSLSGVKLESNNNDDERRLFYVALTRAKKEANIIYAIENREGQQQLPTQFISEIKPDLISPIDAAIIEKEFTAQRGIIFAESPNKKQNIHEKEFIAELFKRFGLSVTGLNNYLKCPWQYFYTNLLRIPKAKTIHQMYGIAIHAALRDFFLEAKKNAALPDSEFLLHQFKFALDKEPLTDADYKTSLAKGTSALAGYYKNYRDSWIINVFTEFAIRGIVLTESIRLTGNLDKVELGANNSVVVVDYKTSKPKTRGDIEGTTKSSDGDIKRQLVFYKLLLDRYENGKYKMASADVDFIEPDEKGRYHKEKFHIEDQDVQELEKLIEKVSDEIINLKFWDRTCDEKDCEYCDLRRMMN